MSSFIRKSGIMNCPETLTAVGGQWLVIIQIGNGYSCNNSQHPQ